MTEGWKHEAAKQRVKFELSLYFNRVFDEFQLPVPNPERVMGDLNSRSTITYHLDVFAEDPIYRKIDTLKYRTIGIEIDGEVGHKKTKKQFKQEGDIPEEDKW